MDFFKQNLLAVFRETDFETKERVVRNIAANCTRKELEMIQQIVDREIELSDKAIAQELEEDDRQ